MTGLRLPPPCRGLRDRFPSAGWGTGSLENAFSRYASEPDCDGGSGDRTLTNDDRTRPSGDSQNTDSIENGDRQTLSSQEDIAMTSAVLVLALGLTGQSPQGTLAAAQGPGKVLPAAQAPGKVSPAAQAPGKAMPAAQAPSKVSPAAQAPGKSMPAAVAPSKVSPAAQAPGKCCRRLWLRARYRPRLRPRARAGQRLLLRARSLPTSPRQPRQR